MIKGQVFGPAELSSLDIVGILIMELFSEHLIGATLGAQNENNSEGQSAICIRVVPFYTFLE